MKKQLLQIIEISIKMKWIMKVSVRGVFVVTLFALCDAVAQEKSIAEQAAEYIEADNKRRGYTNIELMEMRIKVSRERTSELVVNVLAERMKSAHASAVENSVISSSKEDAVKYMETFISRTGACVLFHAAQRDDVISHGSDASHCEKKRKKMAGAFVYQSKALGEIINDPTFEKQAIEEFNTNYEENIKEWSELVSKAGVEGSKEQKTYTQIRDRCERLATEYDSAWKQAGTMVNMTEVETEAIRRLTADQ